MKALQVEAHNFLKAVAAVKGVILIQHAREQFLDAVRTVFEAEYIIDNYVGKSRLN